MADNGGPQYGPYEVAHDQYEPNDETLDDSEYDPEDGEANDDETALIAETFHDPDYDLEDGDDDLFLKYVHEVMQEETLPSNVGGSDIMYSNEEEYSDSDRHSSDNSEKDMENPQFIIGMKFHSVVEFRAAMRNYSIKNRCSDIKLNSNEKNRCQGKCKKGRVRVDNAFQWEADWSGSFLYQVKCGTKQFVVDMKNRTCACRQWDISGIPCVHVMACILKENDNPWKWVSHWYTVDTYMKSYSHMINPINGQNLWPPSALMVVF